MSDSSTLGIGLWLWLPFLSSQGIGYGHGPPLDGAWFCGMGGEQDSGRNCACSSGPGSAAATSEETPTFSKRRRFSVNTVGLELGTDSIVPPILIEFLFTARRVRDTTWFFARTCRGLSTEMVCAHPAVVRTICAMVRSRMCAHFPLSLPFSKSPIVSRSVVACSISSVSIQATAG